jgi:hypothetical protein
MKGADQLARATGRLDDPHVRRYLGHSEITIGPRERLVIAAIADQQTIAELRPDAAVQRMLPHDALLVLERTDPDLVLVDTAALLPGRPWANAGDPSAGDRGHRLFEILSAARAIGRPTVLWWNGPHRHAVGLIPLEPEFDLVITNETPAADGWALPWTTGVQMRRWNHVGAEPGRPRHPVFLWRRDTVTTLTAALTRAFLGGMAGTGLEIWQDADEPPVGVPVPGELASALRTVIDPERLPERSREHGLFVAGPIVAPDIQRPIGTMILRQLASGGRVISGPDPALSASFGDAVTWMDGPAGAFEAVRAGAERGPMSGPEFRATLRSLYRHQATSAVLATLARYLGLRTHVTPNRDVCAVVSLGPDVRAADFVDGILLQQERPVEALLLTADAAGAGPFLLELERMGIRARVAHPPDRGVGVPRWASGFAGSGWIWPWSPESHYPPTFLLDCLVGGQIADASAVGMVDGDDDRFVTALPVSRAIISREAAASRSDPLDGDLASWARGGAPLFGMAAVAAEGA